MFVTCEATDMVLTYFAKRKRQEDYSSIIKDTIYLLTLAYHLKPTYVRTDR